ncbi:hypothetical protein DL770_006267 [Monosporascus sp. CRB-9-2]|nr:hypothetical protein DL770_006267 [Monosporascus sp. CRB-9-2]
MDWRVDPTLLDAAEMRDYCSRRRSVAREPEQWYEDLRLMLLGFANRALESLRASKQKPIPSMEKYAEWLQARVDAYRASRPGGQLHTSPFGSAAIQKLTARLASSGARGAVSALVGSQLRQILTGETDPLQLLFADPRCLADFYEEVNTTAKAFDMLEAYLDALLASFFSTAQERFKGYDRIQYRILDIEEDADIQGFSQGVYDVIVASNVLHPTKDLGVTLSNVRRLLKPNGELILVEMTTPGNIETGFVFGSLPGWWLGSEAFRQQSAVVDEDRWDSLLRQAGFSGTEQVFRDWDSGACHGWSIMVSSALQAEGGQQLGFPPKILAPNVALVVDENSYLQSQAAKSLQRKWQCSEFITEVVTFDQVPTRDDLGARNCILFADLDCVHLHNAGPVAFQTHHVVRQREFGSGPPLTLEIQTPGLLDTLEWVEDKTAYAALEPDQVEVRVQAIGVNFKECLTLLGRVNSDTLGSECSGYVSRVGSGIKRMTNGRGVDVVLNFLSGKLLVASWEIIAEFGRFVEIGRKDIDRRGYLPMFPFIKKAIFAGVDLAAIVDGAGESNRYVLQQVFDLMEAGFLRPPYPVQPYPVDQATQAFRLLQSGKSKGTIVLEIDDNALVLVREIADSDYRFSEHATNQERSRIISDLESQGVNVQCGICDIADIETLQEVLRAVGSTMPPIKGCSQAAMVIKDRPFSTMSRQEWHHSVQPKVQGSWNLHAALPSDMDFFVMLSSAVGIFGNAGQSNYAAGNTFQDALARYRTAHGHKTVAIDLGMVLGEGFVAERKDIQDRLMRLDLLLPLSQQELFAMFDYYSNPSTHFASVAASQIITGIELPALIRKSGREIPESLHRTLSRAMHQIIPSAEGPTAGTTNSHDFSAMFVGSPTLAAAGTAVAEALKNSYSLIALKVRNWLAKEMRADLAVYEILGDVKLIDTGLTTARKSEFRQAHWKEQPVPSL